MNDFNCNCLYANELIDRYKVIDLLILYPEKLNSSQYDLAIELIQKDKENYFIKK